MMRRFMLAVVCIFLWQLTPVSGQSATSKQCKRLNTEYNFLASDWRWISPDKAVFSVNPRNPPGGIFTNPIVWYQYQPSIDKLEKLDGNPYQKIDIPANKLAQLQELQPGKNRTYENVRSSMSGDRFIYPRQATGRTTYWFADVKTGQKLDLGIQPSDKTDRMDIFWFPDEKQFILQRESNSLEPILIVSIQGQKVKVQKLADTPPWSQFQPADDDFTVFGVSPTGNYILAQPVTPGAWLYDMSSKQLTTLDFRLLGDRHVAWTGKSSFIAIASPGVIEYNIDTQKVNVFLSRDQGNDDTLSGYTSLSPDGKFVLLERLGKNGTDEGAGLEVCTIRSQ